MRFPSTLSLVPLPLLALLTGCASTESASSPPVPPVPVQVEVPVAATSPEGSVGDASLRDVAPPQPPDVASLPPVSATTPETVAPVTAAPLPGAPSTTASPPDVGTAVPVPRPVPTPPVGTAPPVRPPLVGAATHLAAPTACSAAGAMPADAQAVTTIVADVDVDGLPDTVTTYRSSAGGGEWRLRYEPAAGADDELVISGVGPGVAQILGTVQVDRTVVDPATWPAELLLRAGANAAGPNLAVVGLDADGCLFRFDDGAGADLVLPVHAAIGTMSGLRCDAVAGHQFLVRLEATADQETATFSTVDTVLERVGTSLVDGVVIGGTIAVGNAYLDAYADLDCGAAAL